MKKPLTHIRVFYEDKCRADKIREEMRALEKKPVTQSEFFRRVLNPDFEKLLKRDAKIKARKKDG